MPAVSVDGCGTWLPLGGVHHGDIHVLRFTPPAPDGQHRLYMDSKNGSTVDLPVVLPVPSAGVIQKGGYTSRIAMLRDDIGFALLNATDKKFNYVLRLQGLKWVVPASIGLPIDAAFYGLDG